MLIQFRFNSNVDVGDYTALLYVIEKHLDEIPEQTNTIYLISTEISDQLAAQIELIEKLQIQIAMTLRKSISDSVKIKFDFQPAKYSLRFYKAEDVPKICFVDVPPLVTDVRFKSDLTDIGTIVPTQISNCDNLLRSI